MIKKIFNPFLMLLLLVSVTASAVYSQDKTYKKIFRTAEKKYLNGNYGAALPLYLKLDSLEKGNANINFKIGFCYFNLGDSIVFSIPYFLEALKSVNDEYTIYNMKGVDAPMFTCFYLGKAYQFDNQFDKAIEMLKKYKIILEKDRSLVLEIKEINNDIQSCKNGKKRLANLLKAALLVVNDTLNTPAINITSPAQPDTATSPNDKIIEVKVDTTSVADKEILNSSNLKFHLVTGCFQIEKNAINFVISLKKKNIQASIIGKRCNLYVVSSGDYATRKEALNNLDKLRVKHPKAWLLEK